MSYLTALLVLSALVLLAERIWPARDQPILRRRSGTDLLHLAFNGHILGAALYTMATQYLSGPFHHGLASVGLDNALYQGVASSWSFPVQAAVALITLDFMQWNIHRLLHRVPFLWAFHQVHHSVEDGEMDFIVSFRFHWMEVVVYKALQYLPLAWLGFSGEALFVHAVFGTLIGHLNHANLSWDYGPLAMVLNSPKMHLWHHDHDGPKTGRNFAIIFSSWDWLFGTAYLPDQAPRKLGFPQSTSIPDGFFAQEMWPLSNALPSGPSTGLGILLVAVFWWMV